jgi:hypothetical protein
MSEVDVIDADPGVGAPGRSREIPYENEAAKTQIHVTDLSEYDFIQLTYHGDGAYRDGTLIRAHEREDAEAYKGRREMAFLKNFFKPVVNARVDPVFSSEIVREVKDENGEEEAQAPYFRAFLEDCDNVGAKFGKFIEEEARESNLTTLSFMIMDNFKREERSANVADNLEKRTFPYVYMQTRDTVQGYSCDRHGKLAWIRFCDHTEKDATTGKTTVYYRYWDKQVSKLQKKADKQMPAAGNMSKEEKWDDVEIINHNLGVLPIHIFAFMPPRKRTDALSIDYEFYDLARCNWTIYNLDSATMEAIFDQCFSLLCIQGPKSDDVRVGTKTVCWVDMTAQNMPAFVSPDPAVAKIASDYAKDIKSEIFEIAEQNGVTAKKTQGAAEQSGKSKEWDFQAHGFILKKVAGFCLEAEIWAADMFKRYTGEKFTYIPHYREKYAVTDSVSEIELQEKVLENDVSPKANTLAKKNIARLAFAGNTEEEVKPVMEEIDQMAADEANAQDQNDQSDQGGEDNPDGMMGGKEEGMDGKEMPMNKNRKKGAGNGQSNPSAE